ncbi:hypothetical protein QOZ80_7AG0562690 [Eleusine coracana subsp. coracana]|nr:hypothetical protein QOZ80_7AG0562690 [Eleusine coracana subsp. coracana]
MAAAEPSSSDSPPPSLRRRERRLVFDRRYGWILDEWTNPAHQALSGGRGMFCVVPLAQSLVDAAASSFSHVASSVNGVLRRPIKFSPPAYMSSSLSDKKQQIWFRQLGQSGVIADL